jgi:hypothetical protein
MEKIDNENKMFLYKYKSNNPLLIYSEKEKKNIILEENDKIFFMIDEIKKNNIENRKEFEKVLEKKSINNKKKGDINNGNTL